MNIAPRAFAKLFPNPGSGRTEREETTFLYLVPRVLKRAPRREEIEAWRPWLMGQLQQLNPEMVVALGKQAGEALEELADLTMPHPHAVLKHGDKDEALRKTSKLREDLYRAHLYPIIREIRREGR